MSQDRFSNKKYIDWVKLKLTLQYAKEGLEPVAERDIQTFFNNLSSQLQTPSSSSAPVGPTLCHACTKVDLKKQWSRQRFSCVSGVCDRWLGLLQQNHVNPTSTVKWDNFDVSQLPVSPWEVAKLYLPYGSGKIKCAEDADLAAILTLYLNCRPLASSLQNVTLCEKVKDVRNNLLHSGTMEIDNAQLLNDVALVKQLLNDPAFAAEKICQDAIAKIEKLVQEKLELSLNKELELQVLNQDIKYVKETTDQLSLDVAGLTTQLQQYGQLSHDVASLTTQVQQCGQLGTQVTGISKEVTDVKEELERHVTEVNKEVKGLEDQLGTQVTGISKEVMDVKQELGRHVTAVNKEVTYLKSQLDTTLKEIDQQKKGADQLRSFIDACQINKLEVRQLVTSISTLSSLRDETDRQGQILEQLQERVGRLEVTQKQQGQDIDNLKEQIRQKSTAHDGDQGKRRTYDITSLQQYLIALYKNECKWENPVTGDEDKKVTISEMYVSPEMKIVRQRDDTGGLIVVQQKQEDNEAMQRPLHLQYYLDKRQKDSKALAYKQIFHTGAQQCTNIYITGDAGMGKTTYCKQLVNNWYNAIQNPSEKGDSAEDLTTLEEFSILFYVNLREVESLYHIEDMIRDSVLHDAPVTYNVCEILETEKCLIVLDGLDEWSCPPGARLCRGLNKEIPGRNTMNENCVFLTTTRNWKFDAIDLKSKDIDKHVELCGIRSSVTFAENVVRRLDPKSQSNRQLDDFFMEVHTKKLDSLTIVPVLFTQLLTLWYFFKGLGKSQVQLYCKMLDLLFEKAKKHLSVKTTTVSQPTHSVSELPECFNEEVSCRNHAQLLLCLSKLAFLSLLNENKEESLVFKSTTLQIFGIDSSDISLCLDSGIFTQSKVLSNPTGKFTKYSFLHKKLQEFVAAVYLVTSENVDENMRQIREYCNKLDTTLEMGQMFMFVCGMKAEVGNQLLEHLTSVVSDDTRVQNFRRSVSREYLIKNIQKLVFACVAEGASYGLIINVLLQDFWIDFDTISDYINYGVKQKHTNIKSLYIVTSLLDEECVTVVLPHLQEVHTLEKLWLEDRHHYVSGSILAAVINNNVSSLRSLCLNNVDLSPGELFTAVLICIRSLLSLRLGRELQIELKKEKIEEVLEQLQEELLEEQQKIPQKEELKMKSNLLLKEFGKLGTNLENLQEIEEKPEEKGKGLEKKNICMSRDKVGSITHDQIEQILSATSHFTHLHLDLYCNDHQRECRPVLDLSNHTNLQTLELWYLCVNNLHAVAHSVEMVNLRHVTVAHSSLRQFIEILAKTSHKFEVTLRHVAIIEDSANPEDLIAYIENSNKFTVTWCRMNPDKTWELVKFYKKK